MCNGLSLEHNRILSSHTGLFRGLRCCFSVLQAQKGQGGGARLSSSQEEGCTVRRGLQSSRAVWPPAHGSGEAWTGPVRSVRPRAAVWDRLVQMQGGEMQICSLRHLKGV